MKFKTLLFLLSFLPFFAVSQVIVDSPEYDSLKQLNLLQETQVLPNPSLSSGDLVYSLPAPSVKSSACECYQEPDGTYTLALLPNDDGSSSVINLPFTFCMYGNSYTQLYINNNGNVTFGNSLSTFSSTAFPSTGNLIIAPFWADVDTRAGNGQVLYKITPTALYVNWKDVGYFSQHGDKLNDFQLILTDGTDPAVSNGNVAFCYRDMQWTTGDASSGQNGFGGVPATCGANKGDGVGFFLISRFDHAGTDFDGALGNNDGISWLDNKSFYFDVCNADNVPPIPDGLSTCDTFRICALGETAYIPINFLSPENNQTTSITVNNGGLNSLNVVSNTSGNTANLILEIVGNPADVGIWNITVTATDNATPNPGSTILTFTIVIEDSVVSSLNPLLTPLGGCETVNLSVLNGPYDSYLWDDFSVMANSNVTTSGNYGVTVSRNGCFKRVESYISVGQIPTFDFVGDFQYCGSEPSTSIALADSAQLGSVTWGLSDPAQDSLFSQDLAEGVYTVEITDSTGYCTADTTITIIQYLAPVINIADYTCNYAYQVQGTIAEAGGYWTASDTCVHFDPSNAVLNPLITSTVEGVYTLTFTDSVCNISQSVDIDFIDWAWTDLMDTIVCEGATVVLSPYAHPSNDSYVWNPGTITTQNLTVSQPGVYYVTVSNECNSYTDSVIVGNKECDIFAPNVIVLSSLQGNNTFIIQYDGVKEFECTIMNRWGNVVASYNDPSNAWNGKDASGNVVEEGVYFYMIKATMENGVELDKQGFVHVFH